MYLSPDVSVIQIEESAVLCQSSPVSNPFSQNVEEEWVD